MKIITEYINDAEKLRFIGILAYPKKTRWNILEKERYREGGKDIREIERVRERGERRAE